MNFVANLESFIKKTYKLCVQKRNTLKSIHFRRKISRSDRVKCEHKRQ